MDIEMDEIVCKFINKDLTELEIHFKKQKKKLKRNKQNHILK